MRRLRNTSVQVFSPLTSGGVRPLRNGGGAFANSGGAVHQVSRSLRFWIGWIRSPSAGYEDWGILRAWLESARGSLAVVAFFVTPHPTLPLAAVDAMETPRQLGFTDDGMINTDAAMIGLQDDLDTMWLW